MIIIQTLFKLAIKYIIPMPNWFIAMYAKTLSDDELIMLKHMCYKAKGK
jgi:hypothetical protein